ncbi:MAG: hypothetical protein QM489_01220 [Candidatus Izemoplasma sp.]
MIDSKGDQLYKGDKVVYVQVGSLKLMEGVVMHPSPKGATIIAKGSEEMLNLDLTDMSNVDYALSKNYQWPLNRASRMIFKL